MAATRPWSALPLWTHLQSEKPVPHVQSLFQLQTITSMTTGHIHQRLVLWMSSQMRNPLLFPPRRHRRTLCSLCWDCQICPRFQKSSTDPNPPKQVQDKVVPDFEHATGIFTQSNPGARDDNSHGLQLRGEITAAKEPSQPTSSSAISNPLVDFGIPLHNFSPPYPKPGVASFQMQVIEPFPAVMGMCGGVVGKGSRCLCCW